MTTTVDGSNGVTFSSWTTAGRPATPSIGQTGFNTTLGIMETYTGSDWVVVGAAASGTITQNLNQITANYTMVSNTNGQSAGPITIANTVVITLATNSRWVII